MDVVGLCERCAAVGRSGAMRIRQTRRGGYMLGCTSYPSCHASIFFPDYVTKVKLSEKACQKCKPSSRFIKIMFKDQSVPKPLGQGYECCGLGCDETMMSTLHLPIAKLRSYKGQKTPQQMSDVRLTGDTCTGGKGSTQADRHVAPCTRCNGSLLVRRSKESCLLGCTSFPRCGARLFFPKFVAEIMVSDKTCENCKNGPSKLLALTFKDGFVPHGLKQGYEGCALGCDKEIASGLNLNFGTLANKSGVKRQIALTQPAPDNASALEDVSTSLSDSGFDSLNLSSDASDSFSSCFDSTIDELSLSTESMKQMQDSANNSTSDGDGSCAIPLCSSQKRPSEALSIGSPSKRTLTVSDMAAAHSSKTTADEKWRPLRLHEEPRLVNLLCRSRWNFGRYWQEIFRHLVNTKTGKLAFPSPEGLIFEMEQEQKDRRLTSFACFREVLTKWKSLCSPTAGDLHDILTTLDLGGEAERCFEEYVKHL